MSELQRSFAKSSLQKLPPEPPPTFNELLEEEESEPSRPSLEYPSDSSSSASSTGTVVPSPSRKLFERPGGGREISPDTLPWTQVFAQEFSFDRHVDNIELSHHAYLNPPTASGPLFVTHHGAGSSGLSFSTFASEIQRMLPDAGVLSLDARGHGETTIRNADDAQIPELDLTLDTLAQDLAFVLHSALSKLPQPTPPPIVLVGHSLGGAVVTHVAFNQSTLVSKSSQLLGHVVLDVVEGSAIDALKSMDTYLSTRPKAFTSIPAGIDWHIRSRTIRNTTSARVSVPALLQKTTDAEGAELYGWVTDLAATKPFWENWFKSLSSKFLSAKGGKLLILAGTDRLDKELMIGQMQGKYQLSVFPEAGHFVHEDQPEKTAMIVAEFYRRNDRSTLVLPPKVDELIKMGKLNKPKTER